MTRSANPLRLRNRGRCFSTIGILVALIAVVGAVVSCAKSRPPTPAPLVVYCAHDAEFADGVLKQFEKTTGIPVNIVYDSEATKSLGLTEMILRERPSPRCDVFWNNQDLGTQRLKDEGVLLPYKGPGWERIPAAFKDSEGAWTGFAARLRVWIVNTDKMPADEKAIAEKLTAADLSRVTLAKPLYGTTFEHYAALWRLMGAEKLQAWHKDQRDRKLVEAGSNGQVKNLVASGVCDLGMTDTDDFYGAKDAGKPVAMAPIRIGDGKTICIPNTVSIIQGTRNLPAAQKLCDYLLSQATELALARTAARQIPLGPCDDAQIPEEVRQLTRWASDGYSLSEIHPAAADCLAWLKSQYAQ